MLDRAKDIIDIVAKEADSILLFHSLSGKDSIAMLDLLYGKFKRIVCVYMYLVKGLEHQLIYRDYALRKYPGIEFIQVPHYGVYSYIKYGYMGMKQNEKQRLWTLSDITEKLRERYGIEWACYGFKQSDSLNRRLMLRSYSDGKEAICWKSKKFYPLSTYYNRDILEYISRNHLKSPQTYGSKGQSSGLGLNDPSLHIWLKQHYPKDLEKIYQTFPMARSVLMRAETKE